MDILLDYPALLIFMLINMALLISWFVLLYRVGVIKKHLSAEYNVDKCIKEAEICELAGDNVEAAKWYLRAAYANFDEITYGTNSYNLDKAKEKIKTGFYPDVIRCGGTWPERFAVKSGDFWECPECKFQNQFDTYQCAKCGYKINN
jgi:hypothetical protein